MSRGRGEGGAAGQASCRESLGRSSGCGTSPAPPPGRLDTPQNLSSQPLPPHLLPDHMGVSLKPNPLPFILTQLVSSELSKRRPALI